jgi:hypothetical protein
MIEGDEEVIWGFLDDIWHWKHQKLSPFDPSQRGKDPAKKLKASLPRPPVPNHFRSYNNSM